VPFADFRLVRGPVVSWNILVATLLSLRDQTSPAASRGAQALAEAPALSNLSAVYQIGFTVPWLSLEGRWGRAMVMTMIEDLMLCCLCRLPGLQQICDKYNQSPRLEWCFGIHGVSFGHT